MKQFKFCIFLIVALFFLSCSTVKEGFVNQKKNNSDEFLIEKKSPLVMPPDYNELPIPNEENIKESSEIKSLISKSKNGDIKKNSDKKNSSFEVSILEKIKSN